MDSRDPKKKAPTEGGSCKRMCLPQAHVAEIVPPLTRQNALVVPAHPSKAVWAVLTHGFHGPDGIWAYPNTIVLPFPATLPPDMHIASMHRTVDAALGAIRTALKVTNALYTFSHGTKDHKVRLNVEYLDVKVGATCTCTIAVYYHNTDPCKWSVGVTPAFAPMTDPTLASLLLRKFISAIGRPASKFVPGLDGVATFATREMIEAFPEGSVARVQLALPLATTSGVSSDRLASLLPDMYLVLRNPDTSMGGKIKAALVIGHVLTTLHTRDWFEPSRTGGGGGGITNEMRKKTCVMGALIRTGVRLLLTTVSDLGDCPLRLACTWALSRIFGVCTRFFACWKAWGQIVHAKTSQLANCANDGPVKDMLTKIAECTEFGPTTTE